ncbi:MAG TPA: elongation factor P [candidate division Zixibacteria bacterium]|nr:elongation factor P [candidate division Zixibacteria bacterium]
MIQATQLRAGMIVVHEGDLYRVTAAKHLTPGNKRGFVQAKLKNLRTGVGTEHKFRSEDEIEQAVLEERAMQYLYRDGDLHVFMDTETYEQVTLTAEAVGGMLDYLLPGQVVEARFFENRPVAIELPAVVELKVAETPPAIKKATASASYKPATLETGVTIQVPSFIRAGDLIRVDPSDGTYLERAGQT